MYKSQVVNVNDYYKLLLVCFLDLVFDVVECD